jgi:hypothetical protein
MIHGPAFSLDVDVGFTTGMDAQGFGLLGQRGFFDHVKVLFDYPAGVFHIETPDPPPEAGPAVAVERVQGDPRGPGGPPHKSEKKLSA